VIVTLLFIAALAAFLAWWLSRQGLAAKPWLETGLAGEAVPDAAGASPPRAAKAGLHLFLLVAGSLLAVLISAYLMRMDMEDWRPVPWPRLLWLNTGLLVLSSLALHLAREAARRGEAEAVGIGLQAAGVTAMMFLAGQVLAWRELAEAGYRPSTNPADAFFYLVTAVHGLHVLGGLVALGRTGLGLRRGLGMEALRVRVELCATYWHFLLAVWIILFGLLAFSPSVAWFYAICRASLP
jgi:cytochrome c oxidase subunit III